MESTNWSRSAVLLVVGALAGAALALGAKNTRSAGEPPATVALPHDAPAPEGTPPSNEISDFPQLD